MTHSNTSRRILAFLLVALLQFASIGLHAQSASSSLTGTIVDVDGNAVPNAQVTVTNTASGAKKAVQADNNGRYEVSSLPDGTYTVGASAIGFSTNTKSVVLAAGQTQQVSLALAVSPDVQEVTVNSGIDSVAAQTAPSGGFIEERTPQSLISSTYIQNFTSPVADFGEIVQIVPGTFTTSANGVGLGQSKTQFRGFPDGDYDIDFDGIPFYDTNTPTHHSWANFPSQWIGNVDFDRSPGIASTIGPTPFGGSIHLLSMPLTSEMDVRGTASYGTWNTKLYDGAFNSGAFGLFGGAPKSNLFADVHHMSSDGYQSFNYNLRNAGSVLYQYQMSPRTVLTGFSGVILLNSNGPNISSTRCMLYGSQPSYASNCTSADTANGLQPYTGAGLKFLLTNNSDPVSWFDYNYNRYQVWTDFEYVSLKTEFGKSWYMEFKPYTLNYDNGELYSNAVPMTEFTNAQVVASPSTTIPNAFITGNKAYYDGVAVAPCNVGATKKGITALPCGIDKYNSYRKYGETLIVTQTSKLGVFRTGLWYEWADTNRHQYPSDPLNNWADQPLPKFNESYWTNSYQPYGEYEFHVSPQFNVTAGVKYAVYNIDVLHHADDGATVGPLTCPSTTAACSTTIEDSGTFTAWLPSLDINYRIQPNWSVYAQIAKGSIVPPSAVYDYNQTAASASAAVPTLATPPKQQKNTTYQAGTVFKANRVTLDGDAYRIRFQNSYSSTTDTIPGDVDAGDTIFYVQPSSITQGVEFESNIVVAPGFSLYLNGTAGNAYYSGSLNAGTQTSPYYQAAPSGLWVAQTPTDTESEGLTYQKYGLDLGVFNHRIGEERVDAGQYHNQAIIPVFSSVNGYLNYTIRNRSIFDGTKIRLTGTNLMDSHNIQTLSLAGTPAAAANANLPAGDTDQFNATTAINGADTPGPMAGRSFSATITFGFAPERNKKH